MITIRFSGRIPTPSSAMIGMETDSRSEKIRFQLPQISEGQSAQMMMLLPDGTPDMLLLEDGMADIPSSMTEVPGRIRAWVEILGDGGQAWNSELFYLDVGDLPPVGEQTEHTYPTAIQDAMDACAKARLYRDEAESAAALAVNRSGMLHFEIGEDGNLYLEYTDTTPIY